MEQVLYVLGAGFSAPIGVPVMANFLQAARDLRRERGDQFAYFDAVLREVTRLSAIKNWINSNQHNIEEVLSILEMQSHLAGKARSLKVRELVVDVIRHRTPPLTIGDDSLKAGNWLEFIGGDNQAARGYVAFACNLLGLSVSGDKSYEVVLGSGIRRKASFAENPRPDCRYAVVTFNYDRVLEDCLDYLNANFGSTLSFASEVPEYKSKWDGTCPLVKVHGCISQKDFVLPTWTKAKWPTLRAKWASAGRLIGSATEVRFVGYSFSSSDAYFEYLLKAALVKNSALKKVDVICVDSDGATKARYAHRFDGPVHMRFANANARELLIGVQEQYRQSVQGRTTAHFNALEHCHESLMMRYAKA